MIDFPIFNSFGIMPTNTHVSAGMDFYIPNIKTTDEVHSALEAFKKSYNVNDEELFNYSSIFRRNLDKGMYENEYVNILHLYLAWNSYVKEQAESEYGVEYAVKIFIKEHLTYDAKGTPGIVMDPHDSLFINSGIKVALPVDSAGIYFNKSGMGNKGWDVRACVVDEDYSGFVHLSMAYTSYTDKKAKRTVYCGDKLTQMVVLPVIHMNPTSISEEEYNKLMANSNRGDSGFGSSDVKH